MGKLEEIYRLPLLPMRRDTRSKLQRVATEAGLMSKAAPPATTEVPEFFIYEKLGRGAAQNRPAPRQLRPVQPRQRTPLRPRPQPCQVARAFRDAGRRFCRTSFRSCFAVRSRPASLGALPFAVNPQHRRLEARAGTAGIGEAAGPRAVDCPALVQAGRAPGGGLTCGRARSARSTEDLLAGLFQVQVELP